MTSESNGVPDKSLDRRILEDGKVLWGLVRSSFSPLELTQDQEVTLRLFLEHVVIPESEVMERETGYEQGSPNPDSDLYSFQGPENEETVEQLNELRDARDVLIELNNAQKAFKENPDAPLVPNGLPAKNMFDPGRTWALIIGNDNYITKPLSGSVADARAMDDYMKRLLRIYPENILRLENARREEMLDALHLHFGKAQKGDALLFYYSGHGASYALHDTEPHIRGAGVEALCPIDRGMDPYGTVIQDISDRELAAILASHAARTGPNITMILDCCFSKGSRYREMSRFNLVDEHEADAEESHPGVRRLPPLTHGLREMLAEAAANDRIDWSSRRISSTDIPWKYNRATYVIIAACQDFERTWEENGRGLFTSRLLKVLEHFPTKNISYREIVRCIGTIFLPDVQHPALLGDNLDSLFLQVGCHGTNHIAG